MRSKHDFFSRTVLHCFPEYVVLHADCAVHSFLQESIICSADKLPKTQPSYLDCYEYAAMRFKSINRSLETCEHKPCFSTYTAHQAGRWHLSSRSIHCLLNTNILQIESCLLQTYTCFLKPQSFHLQAKLLSGLGYRWQSSIM